MAHQLMLKIDPVTLTGQILLNQQPFAPQSPLSICATHSFFDWYDDLPKLIFSEVNDDYSLTVEGPDLPTAMLQAVFSPVAECRSLMRIPSVLHYSMEQRYRWLTTAAARMNTALPKNPCFSVRSGTGDSGAAAAAIAQLPPFYRSFCTNAQTQVNIWLESPGRQTAPCELILSGGSGVDTVLPGGSPLFYRGPSDRAKLMTEWIDRMILAPYLFLCRNQLLNHMKHADFETRAQLAMICRDEPWVELQLPSRMEIGTSAVIQLKEFPASNLRLTISDPTILRCSGSALLALKTGNASIIVYSEHGVELCKRSLQVYRVNRVTAITLQLHRSEFLVNETFSVTPGYTPINPDNLAKAQWSATPTGVLTHLGNGRFRAVAPGKCSITLTVEAVSQTVDVEVFPLPTSLQLPREIRVKLNHTPVGCGAVLLPSGSRCQGIQCRTADPSIAVWDPGNKEVRPIAEGRTELEAAVLGANGTVLFTQKCPVTVLPEKEIVTLPTMLTLAVCSIVLAFFAYSAQSRCYLYLLLLGCVCAGASIITNAAACFRHQATSGKIMVLLLSILVLALCLCFPMVIGHGVWRF